MILPRHALLKTLHPINIGPLSQDIEVKQESDDLEDSNTRLAATKREQSFSRC